MSGEALAGDKGYGIDLGVIAPIARDIAAAAQAGTQICLVVGGGNIFRGLMAAAKSGSTAPTPTIWACSPR